MKMTKFAAFSMALIAAFSMGISAFAAPSPSTNGVVTGGQGTDANGNTVVATVTEVANPEIKKEVETKEALVAVLEKILEKGSNETVKTILESVQQGKAEVADIKEVSVPEGTPMPVTLTFDVNGVKAGSKVVILHYNGTEWENIPVDNVADGKITATFDSLSPVAFIVEKDAQVTTAGTTSPQTGTSPVIMFLAAGVVLGLCGAFLLGKKKSA